MIDVCFLASAVVFFEEFAEEESSVGDCWVKPFFDVRFLDEYRHAMMHAAKLSETRSCE